ncbi:MAG: hypothetical protein ACK44D_02385 [Bacteroidia bacterium]
MYTVLNISEINQIQFNWSALTPIVAIIISIIALLVNATLARRNIRLNIQQLVFKTVSEKAKECNFLWESETKNEMNENAPHFKVISEIIITIETIEKSFELFEINYKSIKADEDYYYYLFWKQLRTDLRGWIRKTPEIADAQENETYTKQVLGIHKKFNKHFE